MQVFKISVKFEENGEWSNRESDSEGYLVKKYDNDIVLGYVNPTYRTKCNERFISGLYINEKKLVFLQMVNVSSLSPICYCFPDVKLEGYWSGYDVPLGFFPVYPGHACSQGHAKINISEIQGDEAEKIAEETEKVYKKNVEETSLGNRYIISKTADLIDFLEKDMVLQMQLHCERW